MEYNHGVRVDELATKVPEPSITKSGVIVAVGTAPVNTAKNPAVNQLVYARNYQEAVDALGYSEDFGSYTLSQVIYTAFKLAKVGPVVFVNVLDPATHKTEVQETTLTVTAKQATLDALGVCLDSLKVLNGTEELTQEIDYIATFDDDSKVLITLLDTSKTTSCTSIKVSADKLDPSAVTSADVIGGYDEETGAETGLELVRQVFPKFGIFPGTLIAPGFSEDKNVAAVMDAKSTNINGSYSCMNIVDISTEKAKKYTDVEREKTNAGIFSKQTIAVWPMVKKGEKIVSYSALLAAIAQKSDYENDDVPANPSNKDLGIDGLVLKDGTEVVLDEEQANTLNAVGVVTAVNFEGFKSWGNNTACYPLNTDPKDRWIGCRRFFNWWENNFILNYHKKVDANASYKTIEAIVDAENIKGNSYVAEGKCARAYIEFIQSENPIANILNGHVVFRMHLAPYTPAEDILNVFEFDVDALEAELGGV